LFGTFYFIALRASWDQLREELGLIFFFIVLILLVHKKNRPVQLSALSIVMMLVVLSHQLVSVLMLGIIAVTIASNLWHREYRYSIKLLLVSLPGALYFLLIYLTQVLKMDSLAIQHDCSGF
jgi:hypothetical protein